MGQHFSLQYQTWYVRLTLEAADSVFGRCTSQVKLDHFPKFLGEKGPQILEKKPPETINMFQTKHLPVGSCLNTGSQWIPWRFVWVSFTKMNRFYPQPTSRSPFNFHLFHSVSPTQKASQICCEWRLAILIPSANAPQLLVLQILKPDMNSNSSSKLYGWSTYPPY